jgi:limonene-1,2-epoxide hydrolase
MKIEVLKENRDLEVGIYEVDGKTIKWRKYVAKKLAMKLLNKGIAVLVK